jgi:hypothetical protein
MYLDMESYWPWDWSAPETCRRNEREVGAVNIELRSVCEDESYADLLLPRTGGPASCEH